jgi:hypothetical protein
MSVVLHEDELAILLDSPDGAVGRYIAELTDQVHAAAVALAPKGKTGDLARSISKRVAAGSGSIVGTVGTDSKVGIYLTYGTGLYGPLHRVIDIGKLMGPVDPPYPKWIRRSRGTRPNRFLVRALQVGQPYPVVEHAQF